MHGREHFRESERLMEDVSRYPDDDPRVTVTIAKAQVHATLARAAAEPVKLVAHDWCEECDGSGYARAMPA
jgi:hypothetical protein